jgi:integrase
MSTIRIKAGNVTLPIYAAKSDGKMRYELRWHCDTKEKITTTLHREKFSSRQKAETRAREVATALANGEISRLQITGDEAREYFKTREILAPTGKPLEQLAFEELARWEAAKKISGPDGATIASLVEKFLAAKKAEGLSDYYQRDFANHLNRFAAEFKLLPLAGLTTEDAQAYLDGLKVGPRTWNNNLASMRALAQFAIKQKHLPKDWESLAALTPRKLNWKRPDIYTPDEMRKILLAAGQPLQRCLALAAFAGLRTEEVHRIDWADFKWQQEYIIVGEDIAKTRQHSPPILDPLKAWLSGIIQERGRFCPYERASSLGKMRQRILQKLNLRARRNALRKSWISYRLAITENEAKVADEAGTSVHDIHRHYLNRPSKAEAHKWFGIRPNYVPENLIQLQLAQVY